MLEVIKCKAFFHPPPSVLAENLFWLKGGEAVHLISLFEHEKCS